jgi:hypothetical protein
MKALAILSALTLASFPAISNASFLSHLGGIYKLSGKNCSIDNTSISGLAEIIPSKSSITLNIEIILGSFETDMPIVFNYGKGSKKIISTEDNFLPTPKRKFWVTDEAARLTTFKEYEGVTKKLTGIYSLKQFSDTTLAIRLAPQGASVTECTLIRE